MWRFALLFLLIGLNSCKKNSSSTPNPSPIPNPKEYFDAPMQENLFRKLFPTAISSDVFEASGLCYRAPYVYAVFDNLHSIGRLLENLVPLSLQNTLVGPASTSSNFEAICYGDSALPRFFVSMESDQYTDGSYRPRIYEYSESLQFLRDRWVPHVLLRNNKGFEGLCFIRRNGIPYLLGIQEDTGEIYVLKDDGQNWQVVDHFSLPVQYLDYAELQIRGNTLYVVSQESACIGYGSLLSSTWGVASDWKTIKFPLGDANTGVVGAGSSILYATQEGLCFLDDSTWVSCSDKASNAQPTGQKLKAESLQVWKAKP